MVYIAKFLLLFFSKSQSNKRQQLVHILEYIYKTYIHIFIVKSISLPLYIYIPFPREDKNSFHNNDE